MAREIKIRITGDSSGLKSAFGDAEKHAEGFGSKVGSIFGGIAKAGAALTLGGVAAAVPLLKSSIDAASSYNEALSKTNFLFGESSSLILDWAETSAKSFGQSRQQALDAAGTFAIFGKAAGFTGNDLVGFSTRLTELGSDFASFFDADPAEGIEAIGAALRGESEPIRRFGVLLSEDTLKSTALSHGLVKASVDTKKLSKAQEASQKAARATAKALKEHGANSVEYSDAVRDQQQAEMDLADVMAGKVDNLTQAQKMQAAYLSILEQSTDAEGDFDRTSDGLANKQRTLTAEFANARQELGSAFLPAAMAVADFLLQKVVPALRDVNQWVQGVAATVQASGWGAAFGQVVDDVSAKVGSLATRAWEFLSSNLPGWLASFGSWFKDTAAPWLGERVADLGGVIGDLATKGWEKLRDNLPGWLANFAQWFETTGWPWLTNQVDVWLNAFVNWVSDSIPKLKEKLVEWLNELTRWFNADANPTAENGGEGIGTSIVKGFAKAMVTFQKQMTVWEETFALWFTKRFIPAVVRAGFEIESALRLAILAGAKNFAEAWIDLGEDIVRGIIRGIKNKAGELAQIAKEVIWEGIPAVIRKRLDMNSPSKVMATIGGQIAAGLAVGMANGASQVEASSQLLAQAAQVGDWPLLSGVKGSSPTITHNADGTVMFAGDPHTYPGSVIIGAPAAAATKVLPRPLGLGPDDPNGTYSLSTSGYGGGGGTYNITINGVIIGDRQSLGQFLKSVLDDYDRARL